jgi:hypothetical protein
VLTIPFTAALQRAAERDGFYEFASVMLGKNECSESLQSKAMNEGHTQVELVAQIRRRTYQLYEQRGRVVGHAPED